VPTITDSQPSYIIDIADWNKPSNIQLTDPADNCPQRVDLVLGASLFYDLLCVGQVKLVHGLPLLQKTRLGWIVTGGEDRLRGNTSLTSLKAWKMAILYIMSAWRIWLGNFGKSKIWTVVS